MELEHQTTKSRWLRTAVQPTQPAKDRDGSEKRAESYFVEPYRFEPADRAELLQTLQANRLGDDSGRRLFVDALEFEIGNLLQAAARAPQPSAAPPQGPPADLSRIGQAAAALVDLLQAVDGRTREALTQALTRRDRYVRGYDQRYLRQLQNELDLVQQACALEPPEEPPILASDQRLSERFVASLAETYRECFDIQPTSAKTGPFNRVARKILDLTGLPVRLDQKTLKAALAR